jgi:hypothetical protein
VALTLMPNNSQPIASIIQHTHKKKYNLSNLQYFLGRNLFLPQDPKIMMESYDVSFGIFPHQKFG